MDYEKQVWVDHQTPLDAAHMNHMEEGIASRLGKSGHVANQMLGTDASGTIVTMDMPKVEIPKTTWNDIQDKPTQFPVSKHEHDAKDVTGLSSVATSGSFNDLKDKPTALKNPQSLRFTGATSATYDGSSAVTINIPASNTEIPAPSQANMQLVTDADGNMTWEERLAYKQAGESVLLDNVQLLPILSEDGLHQYALTQPMAANFIDGGTYTVHWDGAEYTTKAGRVIFEGIVATFVGNSALAGGEDTGEPFVFVYNPTPVQGEYGGLIWFGEAIDQPVISITGRGDGIKRIDPEYLPEDVGRKITLTINEDGSVTSDTDFNTAIAMSDAALTAAITVKEKGTYFVQECDYSSSVRVTRMKSPLTSAWLQISFNQLTDWTDYAGQSDITRHINWMPQYLALSQNKLYSLPDISLISGERSYLRGEGGRWYRCTIDQIKEDFGLDKNQSIVIKPTDTVNSDGENSFIYRMNMPFANVLSAVENGSRVEAVVSLPSANGVQVHLPLVLHNSGVLQFIASIPGGPGVWYQLAYTADDLATFTINQS